MPVVAAADVMEKLINDRVEARYRELISPEAPPVVASSPQRDPVPLLAETGITADTLLSVTWSPEIAARREALKRQAKDTTYIERIENSAALLELVGERPLRTHMPADLQDFSSRLARVPTSRTKRPEFQA